MEGGGSKLPLSPAGIPGLDRSVALKLHLSVPWFSKRSYLKGFKTHNPAAGSGALGCAGSLAKQRVGTGQGASKGI